MSEATLQTALESLFMDYQTERDDKDINTLQEMATTMNIEVVSLGTFLELPKVKSYLKQYLSHDGFTTKESIDLFMTKTSKSSKTVDDHKYHKYHKYQIISRIENLSYLVSSELGNQCIKRRFGCQNYQNVESGYLEEILIKYFKRKYLSQLEATDSSEEISSDDSSSDETLEEETETEETETEETETSDEISSDEESSDEEMEYDYEGKLSDVNFLLYWNQKIKKNPFLKKLLKQSLRTLSDSIDILFKSTDSIDESLLETIRKLRMDIVEKYQSYQEEMTAKLYVLQDTKSQTVDSINTEAEQIIIENSSKSNKVCLIDDYVREVYDILIAYCPSASASGFVPRLSNAFKNLLHTIPLSEETLQTMLEEQHRSQDFSAFKKWYRSLVNTKKLTKSIKTEFIDYFDSLFSFKNPFNRVFGFLVVKEGECVINHDDRVIQLTILCAKELSYLPKTFTNEAGTLQTTPTVGDLLITYFLSFSKSIGYHYSVLEVANECPGKDGEYFNEFTHAGKKQNRALYCKYESYGFREDPSLQICFDKESIFPIMSIDLHQVDQTEIIARGLDREHRNSILVSKFCIL